jgi:esterase/lipase superfamily enzyme
MSEFASETAITLDALFARLEQALKEGSHQRAVELAREIESRLNHQADNLRAAVQRLTFLMAQAPLREIGSQISFEIECLAPHGKPSGPVGDDFKAGVSAPTRGGGDKKFPGVDFPVFFATNRARLDNNEFSGQRSKEITRGRVIVQIPTGHRFGETGSGYWKRLLFGDDRLKVVATEVLTLEDYVAQIGQRAQEAREAGENPGALVYLHGYNNTFERAAIRAAQIGYDLRVAGPVGFFSWPSRGSIPAYAADEATLEASEGAIADFLVEFAQNCGTEEIHVIAHSMGNRGLLRALQRIAANARQRGKIKFNQIILAAPDVDRDLFLDLAHLFSTFAKRTTLYASSGDLAVNFSAKLHVAPRAGFFEPYTVAPGVDTVAVPHFDVDLLGHGYFAQAGALLSDIYDLFNNNQTPPRQRMKPLATTDGGCWRLEK